jgi:hypothetical protein
VQKLPTSAAATFSAAAESTASLCKGGRTFSSGNRGQILTTLMMDCSTASTLSLTIIGFDTLRERNIRDLERAGFQRTEFNLVPRQF